MSFCLSRRIRPGPSLRSDQLFYLLFSRSKQKKKKEREAPVTSYSALKLATISSTRVLRISSYNSVNLALSFPFQVS